MLVLTILQSGCLREGASGKDWPPLRRCSVAHIQTAQLALNQGHEDHGADNRGLVEIQPLYPSDLGYILV